MSIANETTFASNKALTKLPKKVECAPATVLVGGSDLHAVDWQSSDLTFVSGEHRWERSSGGTGQWRSFWMSVAASNRKRTLKSELEDWKHNRRLEMTEGKDNSHQISYATNEQATKVEDRFISFRLGEQEYCVEILRVREIIRISKISPLPEMPEHVKGIINLRGRIIPIIELRAKFGLPPARESGVKYAIVLEFSKRRGGQPLQIGVIVDAVSGVVDIAPDQIEPPADLGNTINTENVQGIGKVEDKVFIILNIDSVVTKAERQRLEKSSKASAASTSTAASVLDAA